MIGQVRGIAVHVSPSRVILRSSVHVTYLGGVIGDYRSDARDRGAALVRILFEKRWIEFSRERQLTEKGWPEVTGANFSVSLPGSYSELRQEGELVIGENGPLLEITGPLQHTGWSNRGENTLGVICRVRQSGIVEVCDPVI
jgi:hypothetical protein